MTWRRGRDLLTAAAGGAFAVLFASTSLPMAGVCAAIGIAAAFGGGWLWCYDDAAKLIEMVEDDREVWRTVAAKVAYLHVGDEEGAARLIAHALDVERARAEAD